MLRRFRSLRNFFDTVILEHGDLLAPRHQILGDRIKMVFTGSNKENRDASKKLRFLCSLLLKEVSLSSVAFWQDIFSDI